MSPRALLTIVAATLTVLIAAAGFPAGASASMTSVNVGVSEPTGNAGASTSSLGISIGFNAAPSLLSSLTASSSSPASDSVRNFSVTLPPGLLVNLETNSGACLSTAAPTPACQIGSGTMTVPGAVAQTLSLYLEQPPAGSDLAGIQLVSGSISVMGALTYYSSSNLGIQPSFAPGEQLSFTGLPSSTPVSAIYMLLSGVTFPSSCTPANVVVAANSQKDSTDVTGQAPVPVTNCLSLPYQPTFLVEMSRDTGITGSNLQLKLVTPSGNSDTQQLRFKFPLNLQLNPAMAPCFEGAPCTVGTFTADSPLFPSGWLSGPLTLSGTMRQPVLGMTFGQPIGLQLETIFSPASLEIYNIPDIPMSSFTITFRGNEYGAMFIGLCYKSMWKVTFGPWSGEATGPTTEQGGESGIPNCYHPPSTISRSANPTGYAKLARASAANTRLSIETAKGRNAPGIVSLAISLPSGLSLDPTTPLTGKVLSLSGAKLARARLQRTGLFVRFKRSTARSALVLRSPLLVTGSARPATVSRGAAVRRVVVRVTDSRGRHTKLTLPLSVR